MARPPGKLALPAKRKGIEMIQLDDTRSMEIVFRHEFTGHELHWTVANSGVTSRDLLAMGYEVARYIPREIAKPIVPTPPNPAQEWAAMMNATAMLPDGIAPF